MSTAAILWSGRGDAALEAPDVRRQLVLAMATRRRVQITIRGNGSQRAAVLSGVAVEIRREAGEFVILMLGSLAARAAIRAAIPLDSIAGVELELR